MAPRSQRKGLRVFTRTGLVLHHSPAAETKVSERGFVSDEKQKKMEHQNEQKRSLAGFVVKNASYRR